MSRLATEWEPITKEEYHAIYNDSLFVYSTYTNTDGDDGLSSQPQLYTTWGDDEKEESKGEERNSSWKFVLRSVHIICGHWQDAARTSARFGWKTGMSQQAYNPCL